MATQDEIKKTILKVAGNPVAGPIAGLAAQMAEAIVALDNPPAQPKKQKRVLESMETREAGSVSAED